MPEAEVVDLQCCCNCNPCNLLTNKTFLRTIILICHSITFGTVLSLELQSQPLNSSGLTAVERRWELATRSFEVYFLMFIGGIGLLFSLLWIALLYYSKASRNVGGSSNSTGSAQPTANNSSALIFRCRGSSGEVFLCNCANWEFMFDLMVGFMSGLAFFITAPMNPCQQSDIKEMFGSYCSRLNSGVAFSLIACFFYIFLVFLDMKVCCCASSPRTLPPPVTSPGRNKYPPSQQPQMQSSASTNTRSWFAWPRKTTSNQPSASADTVNNSPPPYSTTTSPAKTAPPVVKPDEPASPKKSSLYENITKLKMPSFSTKSSASSTSSTSAPPLPERKANAPAWPPNYQ